MVVFAMFAIFHIVRQLSQFGNGFVRQMSQLVFFPKKQCNSTQAAAA
jgi:hypothetical protein